MPRPRVRDEDRKRVAQACDTCKRRKERCDGQHPCLLCKRRGREPECTFTDGFSARRSSNKRDSVSTSHTATSQTRSNGHAQPSPLDTLLNDNGPGISKPYPRSDTNELPPIEISPLSSSIPHMTFNNAYQPSPSTVDGTTNTDHEIAIESLLTLSSGPATQTRPSFVATNPPPADRPFKFSSQPATTSPDQIVKAHQPVFSQHCEDSGPEPELEPDTYSRAPVPKLARLLKDGHGKFVFVGDSSNLAFVQNIRRLVKSEIGESSLTSDPLRHTMVENKSPYPSLQKMYALQKLGLAEAKELVRGYTLATSGVIDLFDVEDIAQGIEKWCSSKSGAVDKDEEERQQRQQQQSGVSEFSASTYYLVLAIGMQVRGMQGRELKSNGNGVASGGSQAEMYLQRGRELVTSSFMEDPSVLTVQSYILIVFYMLTVCRRNGAFMLLGIAVRAAYALGLHRSDISSLFETKERRTRERVWKSLRTLDLYMSASLGRPPATSEIDGGSVSWDGKERSYEGVKVNGLDSSAMLRMCFIFERILNEVYCRREIRVQLVESISRQYRDWTLQLPVGLRTDGLDLKEGEEQTLAQTIGVAHLKGAYYWSIILLTRPFLIFKVSGKIKARKEDEQQENDGNTTRNVTTTLSEACIDAALRSVEIATDLIHAPGVPKRLFMVSNSTFVSAMVIGFAIFGEFDRTFPLLSSIDQAIAILSILAQDDPSARRYEQISTYLRQAAAEHIRRRDEHEVERRTQDINSIFGNPTKEIEGERSAPQGIIMPQDVPMGDAMTATDNFLQQEPWELKFDMQSEGGPILTTSGTLATNSDEAGEDSFDLSRYGFDQTGDADSFAALSGSGVGQPSATDEFPLFSLLTEYDQLQDPYSLAAM
ncbi:hypothetical protein DV736_g1921, partial [Chaetothyriales sp. CBS 134916]